MNVAIECPNCKNVLELIRNEFFFCHYCRYSFNSSLSLIGTPSREGEAPEYNEKGYLVVRRTALL